MRKCGQTLIRYRQNSSILLVYNERRHMTRKSHDITSQGLEESTVWKSLDDDINEHVNCIATIWYTHGILMGNTWTLGQVYAVEVQL